MAKVAATPCLVVSLGFIFYWGRRGGGAVSGDLIENIIQSPDSTSVVAPVIFDAESRFELRIAPRSIWHVRLA